MKKEKLNQTNEERLEEILKKDPNGLTITYPDGTVVNGDRKVIKKPKNKQND
tara:strand:+ start:1481 stop:1636 length:156 start_codon:yes stop_codon:yes gene_type:complete